MIQKRCVRSGCRRTIGGTARRCPNCGGQPHYVARYRDPDGAERSQSFRKQIDAERFLMSMESAKLVGDWIDPALPRTPFRAWADRWMKTTVHLKPKTQAGYESLLRTLILPEFGDVQLGKIKPVHVREWIAALKARGLSASRIRQAYRLLSATLRGAVESGYLARTPCVGIALPRLREAHVRFLSAAEVDALANAAGPYRALVYVLAYGGVRWGEAAALRRKSCDLLHGRLHVTESLAEVSGRLHFAGTKTHQSRVVRLPRFLVGMLEEHLAAAPAAPDALVFTAPKGGPLRLPNFRREIFIPALARAGLPHPVKTRRVEDPQCRLCRSSTAAPIHDGRVRIHDLRHTCASLLIAFGAHPKAVQAHLGHSSIQVTLDRYGHLFPEEMDRVAEGLDATFRTAQAGPMRDQGGTGVPKTAADLQL